MKVATGKICAITGDAWVERLNRDPQDYAVLPDQPWLDGYCVEKGTIRQFVAMPLGQGYTVEEQMTGAAVHGGLQFVAYPMKAERYKALQAEQGEFGDHVVYSATFAEEAPMGLAPGGRMKQDIYDDPYGLDAWDQRHGSRCFVSLLNTTQWMATTGERPPTEPPTAQSYAAGGLPWFEYYGGDLQAVDGSEKTAGGSRASPGMPRQRDRRLCRTMGQLACHQLLYSGNRVGCGKALATHADGKCGLSGMPARLPSSFAVPARFCRCARHAIDSDARRAHE